MADESVDHRDSLPERLGQPLGDGGRNEPGRPSNRRRLVIAGLLAPPAVMTLSARSARAQNSASPSLMASHGTRRGG